MDNDKHFRLQIHSVEIDETESVVCYGTCDCCGKYLPVNYDNKEKITELITNDLEALMDICDELKLDFYKLLGEITRVRI